MQSHFPYVIWQHRYLGFLGERAETSTGTKELLVIGAGKIGSRVIRLMKPFKGVATFDILQYELSELKMFIQQADCITIHIPKSDDNLSFIDEQKLSWMKSGAVLINTARSAIVDEDALCGELTFGRLKAAFYVYWQEPYLGKLKEFYPGRFYTTPHIASTCSGFLTSRYRRKFA